MRSDRNGRLGIALPAPSLVDWDMRSDRNAGVKPPVRLHSLVDWDMRSDRNVDGTLITEYGS